MTYMLCMNCIYPLRIIPLVTHNTQSKDTFYQAKTFSLKNADNKFMVECYIFANELCNVLITSETLFKLITTLVSLVREPH